MLLEDDLSDYFVPDLHIGADGPTLQEEHERILKLQRESERRRQKSYRTHILGEQEATIQGKLEVQAERCRNLQKARSLGSVTLLELSKGCNPGPTNSCVLCRILLLAVHLSIPESEVSQDGTLSWPSFKWYEPMWSIGGSSDPKKQRHLELFSGKGYLKFLDAPRGKHVPRSSKSEQSITQIRKWLRKCRCASDMESPLPTRVLDITDSSIVRLRELAGLHGRYACLSHCWGRISENGSLLTTSISYNSHLSDGIEFANLPKLFQDAVELARALDITYLWIDALCIIQDDKDDWRRESAKMAEIYSNSYLTIAATSAKDSHGTCVSQILPQFEAQYLMDGFYSRQRIPHSQDYYIDTGSRKSFEQYQNAFPLLRRGWVCQERLLTPRVLHVAAQEMFWECAEGTRCQCKKSRKAYLGTVVGPKVDHALSLSLGRMGLENRWRTVVEEYSSLSLSFEKDYLPALAGLAKQFYEQKQHDEYLAGLWRQTLFEDMLWTAFPGPSERTNAWRSPTWSWASVKGSIRYLKSTGRGVITFPRLIEARCSSIGPDSMGELSSGFLRVEGQVITTIPEGTGAIQSKLSSVSSQVQFSDYYPDLKLSTSRHIEVNTHPHFTFSLRLASGYQDDHLATEYFLVLRAVDKCSNTYERIGLAECHDAEARALMKGMYRKMELTIV